MNVRRMALGCYMMAVFMYGCETWTISKEKENRLKASEVWFLWRMLRISYESKIRNEVVLERARITTSLDKEARKRQAVLFGHAKRGKELKNLARAGKIDGKRSRGRQIETMLDSMTVWLQKDKPTQTILCSWNHERWRSMVANAMKHGTE